MRIGRLAGVQVQVHWSVLLIFALIAWSLSTATFPSEYPRSGAWELLVARLAAAVVFLLGLLAHEASHTAVARRNGIEVDSITLWLFGGVAQLHGKAAAPGVELRVPGVGPLVGLLLGAAFGLLAAGLDAAGLTGPLVGDRLTSVRVGDVMTPRPETAPADITVQQLIDEHLFRHRHCTFPLLADGRLVGLVSPTDSAAPSSTGRCTAPPRRRARGRGHELGPTAGPRAAIATCPEEGAVHGR